MKTALYLRCSTDKQDTSIDQQRQALTRYAAEHEMEIVAEYTDEGYSGTKTDRPAFQRLFVDAEGGLFVCVLAYDRSRWGRFENTKEALYWEFGLNRLGVFLRCVHGNDDDNLAGDIMRLLEDHKASQDRKDILTRLQRGRCHATANGHWVKGRPPFGYRTERIKEGKQTRAVLVLGPQEEVEAVRTIFRLKEGNSLRSVASALNQAGIKSPRGGTWSAETVKNILNNPVYTGRLTFRGEKWGGEATTGACPAIVEA